jgi:outer membrane protein OmpA-like peptidoglycan-associated protein
MKHITLLFFSFSAIVSIGQELSKNVYFDVDEFKLTPEAKKTLDDFIPTMENRNLEITGYTDSTGSISYNLPLSKKRAEEVVDYLISNGINEQDIKPLQSKGETTTASTLSQNRRVTITVFNQKVIEPNNDDHLSKTKFGELNQETMDNIEAEDILNVGGLEFHPGRHYLTAYSLPILDKLTNILLDNPDVKIEIQGHICCQTNGDGLDTDTGTRNLSENRAELIYIELIKKGISKDRLTYKGYGATRKLEQEINSEAMQRNRRVSILIIEK